MPSGFYNLSVGQNHDEIHSGDSTEKTLSYVFKGLTDFAHSPALFSSFDRKGRRSSLCEDKDAPTFGLFPVMFRSRVPSKYLYISFLTFYSGEHHDVIPNEVRNL